MGSTDSGHNFKHIVITGASSGIGKALALHYAAPGVILSFTGRDAPRLMASAQACRAKGAEVHEKIIAVTDRAALAAWLHERDEASPIDLLVANAGISAGMGDSRSGEPADQVRRLFEVNVFGVLNTIDPILPRMIARGRGHIAFMSSLAAFRGWPGAPAYGASKAAVKIYGEGLRGALANSGVKIHVVCPGFVRSRMTAVNKFRMPFLMDADKAAAIIARGIARDKGRIAFPILTHTFVWLCGAMPDGWAQMLLKKMPTKTAAEETIDSNTIS